MSTVALHYAQALREAGCSAEEFRRTTEYLTGSAPLWEALCSLTITVKEKKAVLARLPALPAEGNLKRFYDLLAEKGRFCLLPDILEAYEALEQKEKNEGLCVLRCARDPGDDTLGPLARFLCKKHNHKALTFDIVIDPEILGGYVLEIDGVTYDKSVRGQLAALTRRLQKG